MFEEKCFRKIVAHYAMLLLKHFTLELVKVSCQNESLNIWELLSNLFQKYLELYVTGSYIFDLNLPVGMIYTSCEIPFLMCASEIFLYFFTNPLCFIYGQILLKCLSRLQNFAAAKVRGPRDVF